MKYYSLRDIDKRSISDSEVVHLYHDHEPEIEETIQSVNMWSPVDRKIYGYLDCSKNPPFPEAYAGQMYVIQEAGTVGGYTVQKGDSIECITQYSAEGYGEAVKLRWLMMTSNNNTTIIQSTNHSDDIREIIRDMDGSSLDLGVLDGNTIIRRALICIKKEYPRDSQIIFNIGDVSVTINVESCVKGDIIENLRGMFVKKDSTVSVNIPNYQYGACTIIVEYYPVKEETSLKTLRIDMSRSQSSDFFIPKNSILTSITVVPIEEYNAEAILSIYLSDESLLTMPVKDIYNKYLFIELTDSAPIRVEIENYLKGKSSILIEYNISKKT